MTERYVAVISTDRAATDGTWCDVSVIEVEGGAMTGRHALSARLPVQVSEARQRERLGIEAAGLLAASGWRVSEFEPSTGSSLLADAWRDREDDREDGEGSLDNHSRLAGWVKRNVPDQRIRMDSPLHVIMTGGEIFDLLFEVAERFYHHGTDDVGGHPRRMAEFFDVGRELPAYPGPQHETGIPVVMPWQARRPHP